MNYIVARNKVSTEVRGAKRLYYGSKFNANLCPKVLWRNLKQAGVYGRDESQCGYNPNDLNAFFTSSMVNRSNGQSGLSNQLMTRPGPSTDTPFSFRRAELDELVSALFSVKSDAIGPDNISPRFIKLILPLTVRHILHILNTCLMASSFPRAWAAATVLPIPKKSSPESLEDLWKAFCAFYLRCWRK